MRRFALLLASAVSAWPQVAAEANREYATPKDRAAIVPRLEAPARLARIRPADLVKALKVAPGSTVVDLGAGTGTLLESLSKAVGPKGRVIAEDIHQDFVDRARERARAAGLGNVDFLLGTDTDPKLPAAAADLVVILDAYHHFDYPEKMLAAIKRGLRPGGRLAIVEYHKLRGAMEVAGDPDFAVKHVRAAAEQVEREVQAAGYKLLWRREHAPGSQYVAMFRVP
ncbi:MAG: methyltransferase domain-containing protein [Bryobacteraceae bacterium]|nr:methyltransferase domain-containing protein [Bryobacteraceae bacterium]